MGPGLTPLIQISWQGQKEEPLNRLIPHYDPQCYLCYRNSRSNDKLNPGYDSILLLQMIL